MVSRPGGGIGRRNGNDGSTGVVSGVEVGGRMEGVALCWIGNVGEETGGKVGVVGISACGVDVFVALSSVAVDGAGVAVGFAAAGVQLARKNKTNSSQSHLDC